MYMYVYIYIDILLTSLLDSLRPREGARFVWSSAAASWPYRVYGLGPMEDHGFKMFTARAFAHPVPQIKETC